jgi:5-formyltetrahydrofolate cyclo-ligase
VAVEKKELRNTLRACRIGLPAEYAAAVSVAIQDRLMRSAFYRQAAAVVLYAPKDHEVRTDLIFADAIATGRRVLFPKVVPESPELSLITVSGPTELMPGAFGILEPTGAEPTPVADLRRALICVPGLAFSPEGRRLGRGGGYYDRLLAASGSRVPTAGLAFAFQLLDHLPQSLNDQRLSVIITEFASHAASSVSVKPAARTEQGGVAKC